MTTVHRTKNCHLSHRAAPAPLFGVAACVATIVLALPALANGGKIHWDNIADNGGVPDPITYTQYCGPNSGACSWPAATGIVTFTAEATGGSSMQNVTWTVTDPDTGRVFGAPLSGSQSWPAPATDGSGKPPVVPSYEGSMSATRNNADIIVPCTKSLRRTYTATMKRWVLTKGNVWQITQLTETNTVTIRWECIPVPPPDQAQQSAHGDTTRIMERPVDQVAWLHFSLANAAPFPVSFVLEAFTASGWELDLADGEVVAIDAFGQHSVWVRAVAPAGTPAFTSEPVWLLASNLENGDIITGEASVEIWPVRRTACGSGGVAIPGGSLSGNMIAPGVAVPCPPALGEGAGCHEPHFAPGCADAACSEAVCELDPYCCAVEWDVACVSQAGAICEAGELTLISIEPIEFGTGDLVVITGSGFPSNIADLHLAIRPFTPSAPTALPCPEAFFPGIEGSAGVLLSPLVATSTTVLARVGVVPPELGVGRLVATVGSGSLGASVGLPPGLTLLPPGALSWQSNCGTDAWIETPVFAFPASVPGCGDHLASVTPDSVEVLLVDPGAVGGGTAEIGLAVTVAPASLHVSLQMSYQIDGGMTLSTFSSALCAALTNALFAETGLFFPCSTLVEGPGVIRVIVTPPFGESFATDHLVAFSVRLCPGALD